MTEAEQRIFEALEDELYAVHLGLSVQYKLAMEKLEKIRAYCGILGEMRGFGQRESTYKFPEYDRCVDVPRDKNCVDETGYS